MHMICTLQVLKLRPVGRFLDLRRNQYRHATQTCEFLSFLDKLNLSRNWFKGKYLKISKCVRLLGSSSLILWFLFTQPHVVRFGYNSARVQFGYDPARVRFGYNYARVQSGYNPARVRLGSKRHSCSGICQILSVPSIVICFFHCNLCILQKCISCYQKWIAIKITRDTNCGFFHN